MDFGIPRKQKIEKETINKYGENAVIEFHATGQNLARKMELSPKALELLNIEGNNNQISFSFSGADIYIVNTSGLEGVSGLKVNKSNTFTDKKQYEFIKAKTYNLKDEDTLMLQLEETDNTFNNNIVYKLVRTILELSNESSDTEWHENATATQLYDTEAVNESAVNEYTMLNQE